MISGGGRGLRSFLFGVQGSGFKVLLEFRVDGLGCKGLLESRVLLKLQ